VRVETSINDLYRRTNVLLAQFHHATAEIKYVLFKSFCMSMYGCQMWDLSKPIVQGVYTAWRKCIRWVMGVPPRTHNNLISAIINDLDIQTVIERRALNLLYAFAKSSNYYLKICTQLVLNGSRSPLANGINFICYEHNIRKYDLRADCQIK
jgi:hypothetical protein